MFGFVEESLGLRAVVFEREVGSVELFRGFGWSSESDFMKMNMGEGCLLHFLVQIL